jgi:putative ABC transport system ATP-binding protein
VIEISNLVFSYRSHRSVDPSEFGMRIATFTVPDGASAALVGPSGSGKTTLLGLIAGTLRPAGGSIRVNDQEISNTSEHTREKFRLRSIGQVFQTFELLNYLSVIENVMLPWFIAGSGRKPEKLDRASDLLASVGLTSKRLSRPDELSQGEQQRVAVCRAMFNDPPLLLADEPTGNLDQQNKQNVVDLLQEQARRHSSTLLMVTHDEALLGKFDTVFDIHSVATPLQSDAGR